ncbi:MAG: hypothetical protein LUG98_06250, partial [Tannerellaceae bacterium]|nr:hypothetical protein [Tannerellaceae bacterium]
LGLSPSLSNILRKSMDFKILNNYSAEIYNMYSRRSVGGAFLVDKQKYLDVGGENEYFYGWGPEDMERVKRLEILELPYSRTNGPLYHLFHPRLANSDFFNKERELANRKELLKICSMNKLQLSEYIKQWEWVQ